MIIVNKRNGMEFVVLDGTNYPKDIYYVKGERTLPAEEPKSTETAAVEEKPATPVKTTKKTAKKPAKKATKAKKSTKKGK